MPWNRNKKKKKQQLLTLKIINAITTNDYTDRLHVW
jgi:hypothetical protein